MRIAPKVALRGSPLPRSFHLRTLGPGLLTACSDNDPTTVGSLAAIGAATAFRLSWLTLLIFPMLFVVQLVGQRIGRATGAHLQQLVRVQYGLRWALLLMLSIAVVNVVTIAADLDAGAASVGLLLGVGGRWLVLPLAVMLSAILFYGAYPQLQRILKVAALGFLAYVVAAFLAAPDWSAVAHATFVPAFSVAGNDLEGATALLGTTLTGYVFVWATISEAEIQPTRSPRQISTDALAGSLFVVAIFWFILVATGATLGTHHGQTETVAQAAAALEPLAGPMAGSLFALALLASTALALPILIATTGYVVGANFNWRHGLSEGVRNARAFYLILGGAALVGAVVPLVGISPIKILVAASVVGGLGTPVALVFLMQIASNAKAMNGETLSAPLRLAGWLVTAVLSILALAYLLHYTLGL